MNFCLSVWARNALYVVNMAFYYKEEFGKVEYEPKPGEYSSDERNISDNLNLQINLQLVDIGSLTLSWFQTDRFKAEISNICHFVRIA